jgi:putative FmdB family regulatory protein
MFMPIYEFECDDCEHNFEELLRSSVLMDEVRCPGCGSRQIHKKVSKFASRIAGGGGGFSVSPGASNASCGSGSV